MFDSDRFEKLFATYHGETKNGIKEVNERLDDLELRINRPGVGLEEGPHSRAAKYANAAFEAYARGGIERVAPELKAALVTGEDPSSGYLSPADYQSELERNLVEASPVRSVARVGKTSAGQVLLPKRTSALSGYWVGERESRTSTEPAYGMVTVPLGEIACYVDVSTQMLEDSAFDIAGELTSDFAEAFGAVEGTAFISGDGVKSKPEGILTVSGINSVHSGHASTITADGLMNLVFSLPQIHRSRATILLNRSTFSAVAKLKDGNGSFLLNPGLSTAPQAKILGIDVLECPDMPDITASSTPIIIGDFSKYRVFDKAGANGGTIVLRDAFSQAVNGLVRFHGRRRVGATCVQPEAFRKMLVAA